MEMSIEPAPAAESTRLSMEPTNQVQEAVDQWIQEREREEASTTEEQPDNAEMQNTVNEWRREREREETMMDVDQGGAPGSFNISTSFRVPNPPSEDMMQDPDPVIASSVTDDDGTRFHVVDGATQRGKPMLIDRTG